MPPPPPTPAATPPRVVLFGRPGAGKSSLLGALVQAGLRQGAALGAEVVDPSRTLAALRDHVYAGTAEDDPPGEVTAYPVRLPPWRVGPKPAADQREALLCDCDGSAADVLLRHPHAVAAGTATSPLAEAVADADALLLVVSAAADEAELQANFKDFRAFLRAMETRREYSRDVGGLPVVLVLTQCDRLAEAGDTRARWLAKVDRRKAIVLGKFADYLAGDADGGSPYLAFGSLELEVAAVAVWTPPLADAVGEPDEPFGVAELFRDGFESAAEHQARVAAADRRLGRTVWGAGGFVGALLVGLLTVLALQPSAGGPDLEDRVRTFQRTEGDAAARLAAKNLPRHKRTLAAFRDAAGFTSLPADLRSYVDGRLREADAYQAYAAKVNAAPAPADARSLDELARTESLLKTDLALPTEYTWGETEAAVLRDKWLADVAPVRDAERAATDFYRDLIRRETALSFVGTFEGDWRSRAADLVRTADGPPFKLADPLPGSRAVPNRTRGGVVTYAVPFEFDRVYQARRDWEAARDRLANLRDLADALGLTAGPGRPPAPLDLPEPGPADDPAARWAELRQAFPKPDADYPGWGLRNFPEPARVELERRLRRSFERGVRSVRPLVLAKLGGADTPAGWRAVAAALDDPPFRDWERLLTLLARLPDANAPDPVAELADFLTRDRFDLTLGGFELAIPDDLRDRRAAPAGKLAITVGGATPQAITLAVEGEGRRANGVTTYRLAAEGSGKLTVRPGDPLAAELPLRAGADEFTLAWTDSRTAAFAWEKLARGATVATPGRPPEPAVGVTLTPGAGAVLPPVPVLLPDTRVRTTP